MDGHGDHSACDPDTCFAAKCRYWRANGGLSVAYQGGKEFFHESTIPERVAMKTLHCAQNGWDARPKNPLYDK
jgi:hypothetical protein